MPMLSPCCCQDVAMPMLSPCCCRGVCRAAAIMQLPCRCHGAANAVVMQLATETCKLAGRRGTSCHHAIARMLPCQCCRHAVARMLPCQCCRHAVATLPRNCGELPCNCHGVAMELPRGRHVISNHADQFCRFTGGRRPSASSAASRHLAVTACRARSCRRPLDGEGYHWCSESSARRAGSPPT